MKQTFYTGDLPKLSIVVIDGNFTEDIKKVLRIDEIVNMVVHPKQTVFFRRYFKAKS